MPVHDEEDGFEAIGRTLRELRGERPQAALAKRLGVDRTVVVRAEQGKRISAQTAARYDHFYETGGVISGRRRRVVEARKRKRVSPSYRRRFLHVCRRAGRGRRAGPGRGGVPGDHGRAARPVDPGRARRGRRRRSRPATGRPRSTGCFPKWSPGGGSARTCSTARRWAPPAQRVVELAGQYAYYAARIGLHTGDRRLTVRVRHARRAVRRGLRRPAVDRLRRLPALVAGVRRRPVRRSRRHRRTGGRARPPIHPRPAVRLPARALGGRRPPGRGPGRAGRHAGAHGGPAADARRRSCSTR